jgi:hypothetical protein
MARMKLTARKHVRAPPRRNAMPTVSHSDGQNAGYFARTLRTVLLALGSSEPPLFIGTPRLLCGMSYLWHVPLYVAAWAANRRLATPTVLWCSTRNGNKLKLTKMTWQTSPWVVLGSGGSDYGAW